jgi:nucleotide-binding universal stress UspA family protein
MAIRFSNILLPTDFSQVGEPATCYARELAQTFDAQLHCIHVVDDAYQAWSAIGPESLPMGPPPEEMLDLGRTRMEKFCTEAFTDLKKKPIMHIAYGRPFAEIIGYARANNVDLIVMGTHGRGAIAHMLLGSTTEKVVRKSQCAVLTIRTGDEPFTMP